MPDMAKTTITPDDHDVFFSALDNPPEPTGQLINAAARGVATMRIWHIEFGDYGQGYTMRVCRELPNGELDVWGYYTDFETVAVHSALERARVECPD